MSNNRDFDRWLNRLSDEDIDTILYEFYLCLREEECEAAGGCGECPNCLAHKTAMSFWQETVLTDIDPEVAKLGFEILEQNYPHGINKEVLDTAMARGLIELKANLGKRRSNRGSSKIGKKNRVSSQV